MGNPENIENTEVEAKKKRAHIILIVLGFAGLLISIQLLHIHLTVVDDPTHAFSCRINEEIDCNAVARSRQAVILGIPVPAYAIATYLVLILLSVLGMKYKNVPAKNSGDYVLLITLWSFFYSVYLAYVSAFVIGTFCAFCAALYCVNAALLLASFMAVTPVAGWPSRRKEDLEWLSKDPVLVGTLIVFLIAAFAGVLALNSWANRPITIGVSNNVKITISDDPVVGYFNAPVTIIEFSDYECPACRNMHKTIKELLKKYDGSIRVVHKNYPLDSMCNPEVKSRMHPYACNASAAAECAYIMGAYEEYNEKLWNAADLTPQSLIRMAGETGMDPNDFSNCMSSEKVKDNILKDILDGEKVNIKSTPTFIINGRIFSGSRDLEWCSKLIEKYIAPLPE